MRESSIMQNWEENKYFCYLQEFYRKHIFLPTGWNTQNTPCSWDTYQSGFKEKYPKIHPHWHTLFGLLRPLKKNTGDDTQYFCACWMQFYIQPLSKTSGPCEFCFIPLYAFIELAHQFTSCTQLSQVRNREVFTRHTTGLSILIYF